jgi:hypothetical protein
MPQSEGGTTLLNMEHEYENFQGSIENMNRNSLTHLHGFSYQTLLKYPLGGCAYKASYLVVQLPKQI